MSEACYRIKQSSHSKQSRMTLYKHYQQRLSKQSITADPKQEAMVSYLRGFEKQCTKHNSLFETCLAIITNQKPACACYLWGPPGSGKTLLMDMFFQTLATKKKKRIHFHAFIHWIHEQLSEYGGQKNPLKKIAKNFAKNCQVLCLDEFYVSDIGNAMLLSDLLKSFHQAGINMILTSNIAVDKLYENGLARARFLPTIAWIKENFDCMHLDSNKDYRQQNTYSEHKTFFCPITEINEQNMCELFKQFEQGKAPKKQMLTIQNRSLPCIALGGNVAWFDFDTLCHQPRHTEDYWEIAFRFPIIMLSYLKPIGNSEKNSLLRFIHLIDIVYEQKNLLFVLSQVPIKQIYPSGSLQHRFCRAESRLHAMQTKTYQKRLFEELSNS
jgi:cell division protein ZapE